MSAIDDLIARDAGASAPAGVNDIIARDAGPQAAAPATPGIPQPRGDNRSGWFGVSDAQMPSSNAQPAPTGGFLTGVGDAVKGTTQGIVHGLSWAADKFAPNSQFATDARAALPQMQSTIDQQNAQYAQQRAASGQSGIDWGRLAGNAVGTAPTLAIGPEYAGLGMAGKIGLGAVQGAAGAGMMPTTDLQPGQTYAGQKAEQLGIGGAFGAAAPLAFEGTKALGSGIWSAAKPVFQPAKFVGEGFAGAMDPTEAAAAAANIRSAPTYVPGSLPTTAQVAPSPTLIATEKAASNSIPGFKISQATRDAQNNQARWSALNQIAGSPLDLANAQAARDAAANPLYNVAKQQTLQVDNPLSGLLDRPAMQGAVKRAQTLADNNNGGPIFQTARVPNSMGGSPGSVTTLNGNGAQAIKEALDAMLLPENTQKLSGKEIGALQDTHSAYMAWLEGKSDEFRQARQTYAGMSPPINTMQAGQQMVDRLGGLGRSLDTAGTPQITAPGYATALGQALKNQEFGIEPGAQQALENIGRDLQRSTISNSMRSPGSDTAYNLAANGWLAKNLYGPNFQGATGLGKTAAATAALLTGHPLAAGGIFAGGNKVGQMVGSRLQQHLSNYLLSPESILPYLDARAATPAQSIQNALSQRLLQYGRPAVVNGATSGLINANQ